MRLLISGSWVRAPRWAINLFCVQIKESLSISGYNYFPTSYRRYWSKYKAHSVQPLFPFCTKEDRANRAKSFAKTHRFPDIFFYGVLRANIKWTEGDLTGFSGERAHPKIDPLTSGVPQNLWESRSRKNKNRVKLLFHEKATAGRFSFSR